MGGTCLIRPTNGRLASSSSCRSSRETMTSERTRPPTSWVSVVSPKRTIATYSLSWSMRYGVSLVASPIRIGRTPVAAGSSVPAWPTRRTPSRRRRSATTSNDVTPEPLLTTSTPEPPTLTLTSRVPRARARRRWPRGARPGRRLRPVEVAEGARVRMHRSEPIGGDRGRQRGAERHEQLVDDLTRGRGGHVDPVHVAVVPVVWMVVDVHDGGRRPARLVVEPRQQSLDPRGVLHRAVRPEVDLRRDAEVEVVAQPLADEAPGAPEGSQRRRPLGLVAEHRDEDLRHAQVLRGLDLGHGDEAEPGVLELPLKEGRDLLLDELVHAVEPFALHQRISTNVSRTRPSTLSSMKSIALETTSLACRASAET